MEWNNDNCFRLAHFTSESHAVFFVCFFLTKTFLLVKNLNTDKNDISAAINYVKYYFVVPASVAQMDAPSDWRPGGRGFNPCQGRQNSFVEIDHEIFSTVILSLPLIQEGQLAVSGERMCTVLVNRLEDQTCPVNVWLSKLTALDMTPLG